MWPRVKATLAGDPHGQALLDALDDERRLLGPLQAMIDDTFTVNADPGRLRQLLARLRTRGYCSAGSVLMAASSPSRSSAHGPQARRCAATSGCRCSAARGSAAAISA
jgi:hypothetical protein